MKRIKINRILRLLFVVSCSVVISNSAYAQGASLLSWWIGDTSIEESRGRLGYGLEAVENGVGIMNNDGVIVGEALNAWLNEYDGSSEYFNPFCALIHIGFDDSYEFDNARVDLTQSELYGWGYDSDGIAICNEFYMVRVTQPGGYWEDICINIFQEFDDAPSIEGSVYANAPRDVMSNSSGEEEMFEDDYQEDNYEYEFDPSVFDEYLGDMYVVNCEEWVSLRNAMDTDSKRLAKVPLGAKVEEVYVRYGDDFAFCQYQGKTGYILRNYLSKTFR